jgi:ligand-binding SRPBCC domain-containing protein
MQRFIKKLKIAAPADLVFRWHESVDAFEKLIPPWEQVRVVERSAPGIKNGTRVTLETRVGPFKRRWVALHTEYEAGKMFRDEQVSGPFQVWVHTHVIEAISSDCCLLTDDIRYRLPLGFFGQMLAGWLVRRKLAKLFDYRHRVTKESCEQRGI